MTTITVKSIPPELYDQVRSAAAANHRSINREIIACLERVYSSQAIDPEAMIAKARQLREELGTYRVNDEELDGARQAGRP